MSDSPSPQRAPGFVWLLGAFAGFAVLGALINGIFTQERPDPRSAERTANLAKITKAQNENLAKMGLEKGKSANRLAKGLALVKAQAPTKSTMIVPGSPTQLKQAAAAAPAAPAPAPAPVAPAAPAPAK
jgi:hypothetical protein